MLGFFTVTFFYMIQLILIQNGYRSFFIVFLFTFYDVFISIANLFNTSAVFSCLTALKTTLQQNHTFKLTMFLLTPNVSVFVDLISEELKNAQSYTKDFKQQILDLRGTNYLAVIMTV